MTLKTVSALFKWQNILGIIAILNFANLVYQNIKPDGYDLRATGEMASYTLPPDYLGYLSDAKNRQSIDSLRKWMNWKSDSNLFSPESIHYHLGSDSFRSFPDQPPLYKTHFKMKIQNTGKYRVENIAITFPVDGIYTIRNIKDQIESNPSSAPIKIKELLPFSVLLIDFWATTSPQESYKQNIFISHNNGVTPIDFPTVSRGGAAVLAEAYPIAYMLFFIISLILFLKFSAKSIIAIKEIYFDITKSDGYQPLSLEVQKDSEHQTRGDSSVKDPTGERKNSEYNLRSIGKRMAELDGRFNELKIFKEQLIGKKVCWSGYINDVQASNHGVTVFLNDDKSESLLWSFIVSFPVAMSERICALHKGDKIQITGNISYAGSRCELDGIEFELIGND